MTAKKEKFGPGTLKFGKTAPDVYDASCQVIELTMEPDKETTDDVTPLCGDTEKGSTTYSWKMTGETLQDFSLDRGMAAYCWHHRGQTVEFEFVPNTLAGRKIKGRCQIDPLAIGGKPKENLTSKIEFEVVGEPDFGFPAWTTAKDETK